MNANLYRLEAERLYQLLDDIDTMDDAAKGDHLAYRSHVRAIQAKRHAGPIKTDGYTLTWDLSPSDLVCFEGGGSFDPSSCVATTPAGNEHHLTRMEYRLLTVLLESANRMLTTGQLIDRVWQDSIAGDEKNLRVWISRLRERIGPRAVENAHGIGYRVCTVVGDC